MAQDYRFGPFWLDVENERVWRGDEEISLRPKTYAVLRYLLEQPSQLVTRAEILKTVWRGLFVTDAVLRVCIGETRQALADDPYKPQFIEAVHRRGYRFIGSVGGERASEDSGASALLAAASAYASAPGGQSSALSSVPLLGREAELAQLQGW